MNQEQEKIVKNAESNLLAMMMHDLGSAQRLLAQLQPTDFILIRHQVIFKTISQLVQIDRPTDVETVYHTLVQNKQINQVGGIDYLTSVNEHYLTTTRLDDYLKILVDHAKIRKLQQLSERTIQAINKQQPIDQLINQTENDLLKISTDYISDFFVPISQPLNETWIKIEQLAHSKREISGVGTGIISFDQKTLGFQKGDLVILAGRPSMGKTALAVSFLLNAALRGEKRVAMISLEMPLAHLIERMLSVESKVNLMKIKNPSTLINREWDKLKLAKKNLEQAHILLEADAINLDQIQTQVINLYRQEPLDLLVIDYLQLVSVRNLNLGSRQAEVAFISQTFKQLARRLNIPIICLSQLSRSVERREEKRPLMSDLRDSGAIEQDADLVLFIYRPDYYQKKDEVLSDNQEVELIISKHRNGPIGSVKLQFDLRYGEFLDVGDDDVS